MLLEELEKRIAKLEAVEQIKRLKSRYVQLTDSGYPLEDVAQLWTRDGSWAGIFTDVDDRWPDARGSGRFTGHEEIKEFFRLTSDKYLWVHHLVIAPDIDVSDDLKTAKGTWFWLMPCTRLVGDVPTAMWLGGTYTDEYRHEDGVWKFHSVRADQKIMATHEKGWVPDRYIAEAPV